MAESDSPLHTEGDKRAIVGCRRPGHEAGR